MPTQQLLKLILLSRGSKHQQHGFTLIELLVVVILVGILAAIALPNLFAQIGKGREAEFKNALGTINRAQQAYHWEFSVFAGSTAAMGVVVEPGKYFDQVVISPAAGNNTLTTVTTVNNEAIGDGTRAYAGATSFDVASSRYATIVCSTDAISVTTSAPTGSGVALSCPGGSQRLR
jgi:type IV pilus assembly protein PilA